MWRELFTIPGINFTIYGYGLMLVLACLSGISLAKFLARRCGLDPEFFVNIGIIALLTGVIGARLVHVLQEWHEYTSAPTLSENLFHMINLRRGGLVFYGGLLLATPACIAYGLLKKVPIRRGMDIVAPALMVGLAIGRVGCFMNGCCWGGPCELPWSVQFPYGSPPFDEQFDKGQLKVDESLVRRSFFDRTTMETKVYQRPVLLDKSQLKTPEERAAAASARSLAVHPTQIYSTITALLIAAVCVAYFTLAPTAGRVFALMLVLEGAGRFTIENLRVEPPVLTFGPYAWSMSMTIGVGLIIAGTVLLLTLRRRHASPAAVADAIAATAAAK
jgi:phosphatidylglycerol:prolipoprotein diacylglycerol transferase